MATGKLAAANLAATTNTIVYTPTAGKTGFFGFTVCNRNNTSVQVRLALATTSTPTTADYIEYDATIPGNGILERNGLALSSNSLVAYASTTGVNVVVYGTEQ